MSERQSWTWVRDTTTGHLYDVPTIQLEQAGGSLPGVQVIANKPTHYGYEPRPAKHHTDLAGRPAEIPSTPTPEATRAGSADDTEE